MKNRSAFFLVFLAMFAMLTLTPKEGGYIWQPEFINTAIAALFTLLVYLTARIAGTSKSPIGILGTGVFTLLFCPESPIFFHRDETALAELISTCIVPFFISQYDRISTREFRYGYFLMLLMGIFCSYTHDSITIPLCAAFLMMSYLQRGRFFRLACWPMVTGFAIGTTLSLLQSQFWSADALGNISALSEQTATGLRSVWDTKVFLVATLLTIYFIGSRNRRKRLWRIFQEQKLMTYCLLFSFCTIPFAPLGLDNAVASVSFFCMFWVLFLSHDIFEMYRNQTPKGNRQSSPTTP
ncbi:MAG: hypothetical protein J6B92_01255 [Paraprevotella sp.]|jgi:membrane protein|nr:hypothetical protein [Paraprevotella sp.]MBP3472356.1 hypothetical protein [Paraprevotella sp.]